MEVNGTGPVGGPGSVQPSHLNSADSTPQADFGGLEMPQDEVDISSAARLLDQLNDPQVRLPAWLRSKQRSRPEPTKPSTNWKQLWISF